MNALSAVLSAARSVLVRTILSWPATGDALLHRLSWARLADALTAKLGRGGVDILADPGT